MDLRRGPRAGRPGAERDEAGISTIEVVILTPVLLIFIIVLVGLGFYAQNVAQVQGAAQDAARMASLQRTADSAQNYATQTADTDLSDVCNSSPGGLPAVQPPTETSTGTIGAGAQAGAVDLLQVTLVCQVTEFGYSYTITESSFAPVDNYRGGQP
jgi:Flp pilus assembly protein TadG